MHVDFGEPGNEQKETIKSGSEAAKKGGFTGVLLSPNTNPNVDNSSTVKYIKQFNSNSIIDILPAGNITLEGKGEKIVEMHDMNNAGCIAFTDDKESLQNSNVLKIALLYAKDSNKLIMNYPNDHSLSKNGLINEGLVSTSLGLKGMPKIAEEIMTNRDIILCEYTNSRMHLSYISTKDCVAIIKQAKKNKINITADVCLYNLIFDDHQLNDFNSNFKLLPPLRNDEDINSLIKALKLNIIDVITSDHRPHLDDDKNKEFEHAKFGIIGLESFFGLLCKNLLGKLSINEIIDKISINPRKILNIDCPLIEIGEKANITLFDPNINWNFNKSSIKSKSFNTPFVNEKMQGKALAIYNNKKYQQC
jgi:dihydroorotase